MLFPVWMNLQDYQDKKQQLMGCLDVWSMFLPADGAIERAHDEHGEGEVPGVTHGDEHHVVVII